MGALSKQLDRKDLSFNLEMVSTFIVIIIVLMMEYCRDYPNVSHLAVVKGE